MKYREMAKEMTEDEILMVLRIVHTHARLIRYERHVDSNFITVYYSLPGDEGRPERRADFLTDDIYIVGECEKEPPDGTPISNGDILYRYQQFMVADGYSGMWLDNPCAET